MKHKWIMLIIVLTVFLRIFNLSPLSGGDDSEYAQFATFSIEKPSNLLYLEPQDAHIRWGNYSDVRPFSRIFPTIFTYLFGNNDYSVLLSPVLFSALGVLFLYLVIKKYYSEEVALLSSFIFAVLPFGLAFSRIGLLDAQLVFFCLLITWLVINAVETGKVRYVYFASLVLMIDLLTTSYRGVFPLVALVPLLFNKKRMRVHFVVGIVLAVTIFVSYAALPLLWGNNFFIKNLLFFTGRAIGQNFIQGETVSFISGIRIIWNLFLFTPFMNLIIVPFFYGLYHLIKNIRHGINLVWLLWFLSSFIQFVQGQPHPNRQMVILPAFCFIAAYGLHKAYCSSYWKQMFFASIAYAIFSYIIFPVVFPTEFEVLPALIKISVYTAPFLFLPLIFCSMFFSKKKTFIFYLILSLTISLLLVSFGVGVYKRSEEPVIISKYLKENMGNAEYSCIAGTEASTYTYYTGRKCAFFLGSNLSFIKEKAEFGDIKYFIIDRTKFTVGLGNYDEIFNGRINNNPAIFWNETHIDKYLWIMEHTKDITSDVGISEYKIFEYTG